MLAAALLVASASARCPSALPAGEHLQSVTVGGVKRDFYVYIPLDMPQDSERPGVVMIHGCGSSPEKFELESGMNTRAQLAQYYNVYTRGTTTGTRLGWNAGFSTCQTGSLVNDVDFMRAVVLWMLESLCIDPDRLYATGFSNGGSMTFNLTCEMYDTFSAFAFAGSTMPAQAYPNSPGCNGGLEQNQIKPMLGLCGRKDGCGNTISSWFREYAMLSKCVDPVQEDSLSPTSTCYRHRQCGVSRDQPLEYCMVEDLGHCWSGNDCCDSQCTNQDPNNMDFSRHTLSWFSGLPTRQVNRTSLVADLKAKLPPSSSSSPAAAKLQ